MTPAVRAALTFLILANVAYMAGRLTRPEQGFDPSKANLAATVGLIVSGVGFALALIWVVWS